MARMMAWRRLLRFGTGAPRRRLLTLNDRVIRASSQLYEEIDGKVVLLGRKAGSYYGLNELGSAIWRALERETRVGDLCEMVAGRLDVVPESLHDDISEFVGQLLDQELALITHTESPPRSGRRGPST